MIGPDLPWDKIPRLPSIFALRKAYRNQDAPYSQLASRKPKSVRQFDPPAGRRGRRLVQGKQFQALEENLGAFTLEEDSAAGGKHIKRLVHHSPVKEDLNAVAIAETLDTVPLAVRPFDVARTAKVEMVIPLGIRTADPD